MIFREEALAHYASAQEEGGVLRIDSFWSQFAFLFLLVSFATALTATIIIPVHRYASGPAVIRARSRVELTATESGTVISLLVHPGQVVSTGQLLVELDSDQQKQDLARCMDEVQRHVEKLLRNQADVQARSALPGLRAQCALLSKRLAHRQIRAERSGQVLDLHLRVGQRLSPGDMIVSLSVQDAFELLALLPGHSRPAIRPGTPLRIELDGFRYVYLDSVVESVSTEVLGPDAARRALGLQVADSLSIDGPVAMLHARLPGTSFVYDGDSLSYFDGMRGRAEVRTRTERALLVFIPGLREVFRHVIGH